MAIYTRTGDRGKTSLGTGRRVWKDSRRVDAYGTVDELNAQIGVVCAELDQIKKPHAKYLKEILTRVQSDLFSMGGILANSKDLSLISHFPERIKRFEQEIDFMMGKTPPLTNFILPQGGKVGSLLQLARTVSRRAERKIVSLARKVDVDERVTRYINRLSDLFLATARYSDYKEKKKETIWSRTKIVK